MNDAPDLIAELEDKLRFEMLMTELSARFVSVTSESFDNEIANGQRQICQALDLERSTLFQVEDGERYSVTHSWQLPSLEPFPAFLAKDLPWISSVIFSGGEVCYAHIDDMPEEAVREKEVARRFGPRSSVTFPLKVGGRVIGAISFGTVHRERQWPDAVVNRLRLFVEIIGNSIARLRAERATQEALDEVRRLRDQLQRENLYLQQEVKAVRGRAGLVGESPGLGRVLEQVGQVAGTSASVLLM